MNRGKSTRRFAGLLAAVLFLLAGCGRAGGVSGTSQEEMKRYALVTKAQGNPYNELLAEGFQQVIDAAGGNCVISSPEQASAEAQIECIDSLIEQDIESIAVSADDADALSPVLQRAMAQGIAVSTVDSDVAAGDRSVFVNQVSAQEVARMLADTVYDITGGSGQWAILSTSSRAANQNEWIRAIRRVLEEDKYRNLRLVDIVYGNDESEASRAAAEKLLADYPELSVICAPTVVGLLAAAETAAGADTDVKVTGLGLPSDMADFVSGSDPVCPCFFLWDPVRLGRLSAYVSLALADGSITGAAGEIFRTDDMGLFEIEEREGGGTEVIAGTLIRFDAENIADWADLF